MREMVERFKLFANWKGLYTCKIQTDPNIYFIFQDAIMMPAKFIGR